MENSLQFLKNLKIDLLGDPSILPLVYAQKNWKQVLKNVHAHIWPKQHCAQQPKVVNNPDFHQQTNGKTNYIIYIHTTRHYSVTRSNEALYWCTLECGWPSKHYATRSQSDTKSHILYDSTYMKYLEQINQQRQNAYWWLPEAGWKGEGREG